MTTEVRVPTLGESVSEATVANWRKAPGDSIAMDEPLVELETDKVTLEVNSPVTGAISEILAPAGANVEVDALLCTIAEGAATPAPAPKLAAPAATAPTPQAAAPATVSPPASERTVTPEAPNNPVQGLKTLSPAVRKLVEDNNLDPTRIKPSGKGGRLTKPDVQAAIDAGTAKAFETSKPNPSAVTASTSSHEPPRADDPREERVPMSRLRRAIARRLKEAQNNAAMLTTYNETDMGPVMGLRSEYRDAFEKKHGVRLGFMSFFVKACVNALKELPAVNAEVHGVDIIYKNYYDIGVAVGTPQGLVVPVLRNANTLGFAGVEKTINDFGRRARDGKLTLAEMSGGTFTISNGGVYGSLMSSPILNPPQSGILGMHKIQERPMAIGGKVEIRPMMYLALSYDHRIVDGREAVTFLVRVKEAIEDPRRLLIDM
ncbi:MAG: 2-oxoglutarate dehydrogenase complex dihydrolipoyllysine-residue succinyltransferase [Alphaproteobacteria bacterium]|nr:2-oxoglutarate dehydrogenase complex dihydrolipoyllysine-residue succinyltransferase [Alphaproteobacteria bacterium]